MRNRLTVTGRQSMPFSKMVSVSRRRSNGDGQLPLPLSQRKSDGKHGGARPGSGRKKGRTRVAHRVREVVRKGQPVHVTLRLRPEAAGLRRRRQYQAIRAAILRYGHKIDFAINEYSVQGNHVHLVCEPNSARALARGIQVFSSVVARRLNKLIGRRGKVFGDRYHSRALRTPREVRNVLAYVLQNWRHHGVHRQHKIWIVDPFSSAQFFDAWADDWRPPRPGWMLGDEPIPIAPARGWLLGTGWRKHGLIQSPRRSCSVPFSKYDLWTRCREPRAHAPSTARCDLRHDPEIRSN